MFNPRFKSLCLMSSFVGYDTTRKHGTFLLANLVKKYPI